MTFVPNFAEWWQQTPEGIEAKKQHAAEQREQHEEMIRCYGQCHVDAKKIGEKHKKLVAAAKVKRDSTKLAAEEAKRAYSLAIGAQYGATAPFVKLAERLKNEIQDSSGLYADAIKTLDKLSADLLATPVVDKMKSTGKMFAWGAAELVPVSNRESISRRCCAIRLARVEVGKIMTATGDRRQQLKKLFDALPKIVVEEFDAEPVRTVV